MTFLSGKKPRICILPYRELTPKRLDEVVSAFEKLGKYELVSDKANADLTIFVLEGQEILGRHSVIVPEKKEIYVELACYKYDGGPTLYILNYEMGGLNMEHQLSIEFLKTIDKLLHDEILASEKIQLENKKTEMLTHLQTLFERYGKRDKDMNMYRPEKYEAVLHAINDIKTYGVESLEASRSLKKMDQIVNKRVIFGPRPEKFGLCSGKIGFNNLTVNAKEFLTKIIDAAKRALTNVGNQKFFKTGVDNMKEHDLNDRKGPSQHRP